MPKNFPQILPEIIEFMHKIVLAGDEKKVKDMIHITQNFLLILDANKADNYKLALAEEFIDEAGHIMGINYETDLEVNRMFNTLIAYIPIDRLNPQLVTFWLGKSCDEHQIKNMQTLMLYLDNAQKAHIFNMDEELRADPLVSALIKYLD